MNRNTVSVNQSSTQTAYHLSFIYYYYYSLYFLLLLLSIRTCLALSTSKLGQTNYTSSVGNKKTNFVDIFFIFLFFARFKFYFLVFNARAHVRNLIFDGSTFSATGPFRLAIFFFNVRLTLGFPPPLQPPFPFSSFATVAN